MKKRKIAYITGTRADFGLMSSVLKSIDNHPQFTLQVFATGMHLIPKFGFTFKEVKSAYPDAVKISSFFEDSTKAGMAKFIADFQIKFWKALKENKPDLVLVLGDRAEMLGAAVIANYYGLPVAHVHGGDKTTTIDETARHAITKLSHLHFAATKDSGDRIKKLGEQDWRIHIVGAPSLDNVLSEKIPNRKEINSYLGLEADRKFILVLLHPVTKSINESGVQMEQTLKAVKSFNLPVAVVYPNADAGGLKIIQVIEREKNNPNFHLFPSVEYSMFLGLERETAVWVGNSSAGIIESASFQTPVVNIGDRQKGRPQSGNVINALYSKNEIENAINKSLSDKNFLAKLKKIKNIWGDGKTGKRIVKILSETDFNNPRLVQKIITY